MTFWYLWKFFSLVLVKGMLNNFFVPISIYAMFERQKQIIWSVIDTATFNNILSFWLKNNNNNNNSTLHNIYW